MGKNKKTPSSFRTKIKPGTNHRTKSVLRKIAKKAYAPRPIREAVFKRDDYKCVYCGSKENLTIDHKVPVSKGGLTVKSNLLTACGKCNQLKSHHQLRYVNEWNRLMK